MFTIGSVVSVLGMVASNIPAFIALGSDVIDMFDRGEALVSSDTTLTGDERKALLDSIADLRNQIDARIAELKLQAPDS